MVTPRIHLNVFSLQITDMQRREVKKIESTINEAEVERLAQRKELMAVQGQRNILASQLIKRNEELGLLYEKIRVQQSALQQGEGHYKQFWDESNTLRAQIEQMTDRVKITGNSQQSKDMGRELTNLERELFAEKHKVRVRCSSTGRVSRSKRRSFLC